jgi:hypothetical protein
MYQSSKIEMPALNGDDDDPLSTFPRQLSAMDPPKCDR